MADSGRNPGAPFDTLWRMGGEIEVPHCESGSTVGG